eukprot:gene7979-9815_t
MNNNYNENSVIQQNTIRTNCDVLLKAMEIQIQNGCIDNLNGNYNISDLGCAHGRSSQILLNVIIKQFRKYATSMCGNGDNGIAVFHNDTPQNNFNELFTEIMNNPSSYLKISPNIYPMAVANSFYNQILPSNSIHFALGFSCFHWASKKLYSSKHSVVMVLNKEDDKSSFLKYRKSCIEDLTTIFLQRGKELINGGMFVCNILSTDNKAFQDVAHLYRSIKRIWNEMARDKIISVEEAENIYLPWNYYTEKDIHLALEDPRVSEYGLKIRFSEWRENKCPYADLVDSHGIDYFAEKVTCGFNAFTEPCFRSSLKGNQQYKNKVWREYNSRLIEYSLEKCLPSQTTISINQESVGGASC